MFSHSFWVKFWNRFLKKSALISSFIVFTSWTLISRELLLQFPAGKFVICLHKFGVAAPY